VTVVNGPPVEGAKPVMAGAAVPSTVNVVLTTLPPGVVTCQRPEVEPDGTVVVIEVALATVKVAGMVPSCTCVAPVKLVPVSVTEVPAVPMAGENIEIVGAGIVVQLPVEVPVPAELTTAMGPVAPAGAKACSELSLSTVRPVAATPPKVTEVTPVKSEPFTVTCVKTGPEVGEKLATVGAAAPFTVKLVEVATPPGVVTRMEPVTAPGGTVVLICVALITVKVAAAWLLKRTELALPRFVPVSMTVAPRAPLPGESPVTVGAGIGVKLDDEVPVPVGVVTLIGPAVAVVGTNA
jgi:hypothetical protein